MSSKYFEETSHELAGYGDVLGRVPVDLSGNPINKIAIPKLARGLQVYWVQDNNGQSTGNVLIYLGEQGSIPWGALLAPTLSANMMAICTGPLAAVTQHGVYLTLVLSAGAKGILVFEFTSGSLKRGYTA